MSLTSFALSYQQSPIFLVQGIAGTGTLPLSSYLGGSNQGITGPASLSAAQFRIIPGHTLMDIEVATYPFANLQTAANAVFVNGLKLSIEMLIPANADFPFSAKLSVITNLKKNLDSHTSLGGWYNIATPSYIYQGCLLLSLKDASDEEEGQQPQVRWIWDFFQPLVTANDLQAAQNPYMNKISAQTQNAGDPPGSQPLITGISDPSSGFAPFIVPAAQGSGGTISLPTAVGGTVLIQSVSPIAPGS